MEFLINSVKKKSLEFLIVILNWYFEAGLLYGFYLLVKMCDDKVGPIDAITLFKDEEHANKEDQLVVRPIHETQIQLS